MDDDETITAKPSSSIDSLVADIGSNRRRRNQPQLLHNEKLGSSPSSIEEEDNEEKIEKVLEDSNSKEEIIKELKNIQRQNTLTHYLLTASILITLAWQLSEYSLIWKIKQGFKFKNPLKSITGSIKGVFNTIPQKKDHNHHIQVTPPTYLPGLKIPDLPGFDTSNDDDGGDD